MVYTEEQISILKEEYTKMIDSVLFELKARKIGNQILANSPKLGKVTVYAGAALLSTACVTIAGSILKQYGINVLGTPMTIFAPLLGATGVAGTVDLGSEWSKRFDFTEIERTSRKNIDVLDFLCERFTKLRECANLDSYNFQNLINYMNQLLQYRNKMGQPISAHFLLRFLGINHNDELTEDNLRRKRMYIELLKSDRQLWDGFNSIYRKSCEFYNTNVNNYQGYRSGM